MDKILFRLRPDCLGCLGKQGWTEHYDLDGPGIWEVCPVCQGTGKASWGDWLWEKMPVQFVEWYADWRYDRWQK